MFDQFAETLCGGGYKILSFDFYGHGLSNAPQVNLWPCASCRSGLPYGNRRGRYDIDFFVEQAEDLLAGIGLGDTPLVLIGFSLGGTVAIAFAHRNPDRVRRIVTLSPAGFLPSVPRTYCLLRICWWWLIPCADNLLCSCWYKKERFAKSFVNEDPFVIHQLWRRFVWSLFVKRGVANATLALMLRVPWSGMEKLFRNVGQHTRPVLLIWGERDQLNPLPHTPRQVLSCFSNAFLVVIKDAAHTSISDQPQQVCQYIYDFLQLPQDTCMKDVGIMSNSSSSLLRLVELATSIDEAPLASTSSDPITETESIDSQIYSL